jgi:hypothetical protein
MMIKPMAIRRTNIIDALKAEKCSKAGGLIPYGIHIVSYGSVVSLEEVVPSFG